MERRGAAGGRRGVEWGAAGQAGCRGAAGGAGLRGVPAIRRTAGVHFHVLALGPGANMAAF